MNLVFEFDQVLIDTTDLGKSNIHLLFFPAQLSVGGFNTLLDFWVNHSNIKSANKRCMLMLQLAIGLLPHLEDFHQLFILILRLL
jgi:hypothetical protein